MMGSCHHFLSELHDDERGTSLTEFVISLPLFVLIMGFIYYMGIAGNGLVEEWNAAQRDLWTEVQTVQQSNQSTTTPAAAIQKHLDPMLASTGALSDLSNYEVRNSREEVWEAVDRAERQTIQGLGSGGHWGESFQRARSPESTMSLFVRYPDNSPTATPSDVIGGSQYAGSLVNDAAGAQALDFGGARGLSPVLGASVRYGTIQVIRETSFAFTHHWEMPIKAEFNVLVAPAPPKNAAAAASGVTRAQLNNYKPYRDLLGISNSQPVQKSSAPGVPTHWSTPD